VLETNLRRYEEELLLRGRAEGRAEFSIEVARSRRIAIPPQPAVIVTTIQRKNADTYNLYSQPR